MLLPKMVQMVGVPKRKHASRHAREFLTVGNDRLVVPLACKTDNADRWMGINSPFENSSWYRCFECVEVRQGQ